MSHSNPFFLIQDITPDEMNNLQHVTHGLNENQLQNFIQIYTGKRKKSQDIMLFTLLGFIGFAGVQRLMLEQIAMGIIYFLTAGFCFIGTIIDLINYKAMTDEYNRKAAAETMMLLSGSYRS